MNRGERIERGGAGGSSDRPGSEVSRIAVRTPAAGRVLTSGVWRAQAVFLPVDRAVHFLLGVIMTTRNPWHRLPGARPYTLPEDRPFVEAFNRSATASTRIHVELMPEPFFGRFDAPIVVLLLNPGFSAHDVTYHSQPTFRAELRAAIKAESKFGPHFHLRSNAVGPGNRWWLRAARPLIERVGQECVAANLLAVEYFPYHSKTFRHAHLRLPSQEFSFSLVRTAIARRATIICVRGANVWFGAVPELASYRRLVHVRNPRNSSLSEKNLSSHASVVAALRRHVPPDPAVNTDAAR